MTSEITNSPKVYIAIPTGSIKEYASLQMLASLRNIYYPKDKLELNIAITDRGDQASKDYIKRFKTLIDNSQMPYPYNIHIVKPTEKEAERWGPYCAVIANLHHLRLDFLEKTEFGYWWLLGGDNPPLSNVLNRLLALNVDYAGALVSQRPTRGREFDPDGYKDAYSFRPISWEYMWTAEDIHKRKDLEPKLKHSFLRAFVEMPCMRLFILDKEHGPYTSCNFGSGCTVATREVMEYCGYFLGAGYHSEDLHFGQWANLLGFQTALDPNTRCLHFDPDGRLY